ncbi:MAG TPA: tetratricopeptide repeat protein [Methylomirabilota bacterium]|nr:tetratricopeptide repeat protein [Methylomirabilota bacterium]
MIPSRRPSVLVVPLALVVAVAAGGWWGARAPRSRSAIETPRLVATPAAQLTALTDEAIRFYAAGQFPRACERFNRAREDDPASTARREDLARCFEGWGWDTLRQGRPEEAMLLFRRGLRQSPDGPALLRGLGLAAVHAGRADEALAPLEAAARTDADAEVRVLLAHLYDRRDDAVRALEHLRGVLSSDPGHGAARRLLEKVEREARAEAGFQREVTPHFVVKWRAASDAEARRALLAGLAAARERVVTQLGQAPRGRVTVILYEAAQFQDVARVHGWVTGLFDGKIRLPAAGALPRRHELERILAHEYAHATIHDLSRGRAPRWLHEGLAQALEGATPDPMLRIPGRPALAGLEALLADSDPARARTGYDVALWVVQDLLDRGGAPAMRELMARLGRGEPIATAVSSVYGLSLAELERQWRRLLGG